MKVRNFQFFWEDASICKLLICLCVSYYPTDHLSFFSFLTDPLFFLLLTSAFIKLIPFLLFSCIPMLSAHIPDLQENIGTHIHERERFFFFFRRRAVVKANLAHGSTNRFTLHKVVRCSFRELFSFRSLTTEFVSFIGFWCTKSVHDHTSLKPIQSHDLYYTHELRTAMTCLYLYYILFCHSYLTAN